MLQQWSATWLCGILNEYGVLSLTEEELTFFPVPTGAFGLRRMRLEEIKEVVPESGWMFWHVVIKTDRETFQFRISGNVDDNVRQIRAAVAARKAHSLERGVGNLQSVR